MLKRTLMLLMLSPAPSLADSLRCKDAAAVYNYTIFTSKVLGAVSGACADDADQKACAALMDVVEEDGDLLERAKEGNGTAHLNYLKKQCPDDFPEDPAKF